MSTITPTRPDVRGSDLPLTHPTLPRWAPILVAVLATAGALLLGLSLGWGTIGTAVVAVALFAVGWPVWTLAVEGERSAKNRLVTTLVWSAFGIAMIPLTTLVWTPRVLLEITLKPWPSSVPV